MNSAAMNQLTIEAELRRDMLREARECYRRADLPATVEWLLRVVEHHESNERRLLQLTADCHSMIQLCQKAIESEAMRRPLIVQIEKDDVPRPAQEKTST